MTVKRVLGCLYGGAIGDALGLPVEFLGYREIQQALGPAGVSGYLVELGRNAEFSDDTQMTLFTLEALVGAASDNGSHQSADREDLIGYFSDAYQRWYSTQSKVFPGAQQFDGQGLIADRRLWKRQDPGNTCLSALGGTLGTGTVGTVADPINNSKGCGGVMRVAPIGLVGFGPEVAYRHGCDAAAITHGHPSGYLASGALAMIIDQVASGATLAESVEQAIDKVAADPYGAEVVRALQRAVELAADNEPTAQAVAQLGQGWVAEEALAISVYCAMVATDFAHGVLLAVNHSGDSDSTGSITGQILGAMWGVDAIPAEWVEQVEMTETIAALAHQLHDAYQEAK